MPSRHRRLRPEGPASGGEVQAERATTRASVVDRDDGGSGPDPSSVLLEPRRRIREAHPAVGRRIVCGGVLLQACPAVTPANDQVPAGPYGQHRIALGTPEGRRWQRRPFPGGRVVGQAPQTAMRIHRRPPDDHLLAGPEGVTEQRRLRRSHRPGRPRVRRRVVGRSGQRAAAMRPAAVPEETPRHHDLPGPHGIAAAPREVAAERTRDRRQLAPGVGCRVICGTIGGTAGGPRATEDEHVLARPNAHREVLADERAGGDLRPGPGLRVVRGAVAVLSRARVAAPDDHLLPGPDGRVFAPGSDRGFRKARPPGRARRGQRHLRRRRVRVSLATAGQGDRGSDHRDDRGGGKDGAADRDCAPSAPPLPGAATSSGHADVRRRLVRFGFKGEERLQVVLKHGRAPRPSNRSGPLAEL